MLSRRTVITEPAVLAGPGGHLPGAARPLCSKA